MTQIWIPIVIFAVLSTAMGLILAIASRVLAVKRDERIEQIEECLPGANCGGCGYAGCSALAEAIVRGDAKPSACAACSDEAREKMAAIMGVAAEKQVRMVAKVLCAGTTECAKHRFDYSAVGDCHSAEVMAGGDKECAAGCIGLGSCVVKCAFDAISVKDGVAVVDREKCRGCGVCVAECPKKIIRLIPYDATYFVQCSTPNKGKTVTAVCSAGCIGCRMCTKVCEAGAIHMEGDMAVIDYEKCTGCGACAEKCPRKIIRVQTK